MARSIRFSELCNFHARQWEATHAADSHRYTLYGGSRGPGKSYWLRWWLLRFLLLQAQRGRAGVQVALFCETYRELIDRQVSKVAMEFPGWIGELKTSKTAGFGFYLRPEYGRGVLLFRNLDDPTKYQSAEFAAIAVDELTQTQERTFNVLRGSLRWPGVTDTRFIAATNPNGRWSDWVRAYWVERKFPPELAPVSDEFVFIKALPAENPHLPKTYWDELNTLPEVWRRAWRDGDWYALAEGIVYSEFSQENVTDADPDMSKPFELAFDDGYIDPRAILFIQRTGTGVLVFDELYHTKTLDEHSVKMVLERCAHWSGKALPHEWAGWTLQECAMWCRSNLVRLPDVAIGSSEASQLMRRLREADIVARGGTHRVVEGVKVVRGLILDGQGYRALRINARCTHLINEITRGYVYPPGGRRDSEKPADGNDHACDALRYWAWVAARPTHRDARSYQG